MTRHLFRALMALAFTAAGFSPVTAAGFGVSPSGFDLELEQGSSISRKLLLHSAENTSFSIESSNPQSVMAFPSKGLVPKGGVLTLVLSAHGLEHGQREEFLTLRLKSASSSDDAVNFAFGTKIRVKLNILKSEMSGANPLLGSLTASGIVLSGLAAYYSVRNRSANATPKAL